MTGTDPPSSSLFAKCPRQGGLWAGRSQEPGYHLDFSHEWQRPVHYHHLLPLKGHLQKLDCKWVAGLVSCATGPAPETTAGASTFRVFSLTGSLLGCDQIGLRPVQAMVDVAQGYAGEGT